MHQRRAQYSERGSSAPKALVGSTRRKLNAGRVRERSHLVPIWLQDSIHGFDDSADCDEGCLPCIQRRELPDMYMACGYAPARG